MKDKIPSATLNPKEERRLLRGHAWAYRNEFKQLPEAENGAIIDVFSSTRRFVGRGFYQKEGGIAVRLLSRHQETLDDAFLAARIEQARMFRERLFPGENVYRWVFGESDGLPGFVADRYGEIVSAQTTCTFYSDRCETIAGAFMARPDVLGVVMECGSEKRAFGKIPESIHCAINGIQTTFSTETGQKTGLFLDQRQNYPAIEPFAKDARVLDGHCYVGLWSCHAARAGAASVLGVDTSARAIEQAQANTAANGLSDRCTFECAEIETVLERGETYDLVIVDPPAYAKSRGQLSKSLAHYQALNAAAMRAVTPGGILATSSCSHFVNAEAFVEMLKHAASTAQRQIWLLELRGASPDHPVLLSMPETSYLKCAVLRVL